MIWGHPHDLGHLYIVKCIQTTREESRQRNGGYLWNCLPNLSQRTVVLASQVETRDHSWYVVISYNIYKNNSKTRFPRDFLMDNVGFIDPEFVEDDSLSPHWILLNHLAYGDGLWSRSLHCLVASNMFQPWKNKEWKSLSQALRYEKYIFLRANHQTVVLGGWSHLVSAKNNPGDRPSITGILSMDCVFWENLRRKLWIPWIFPQNMRVSFVFLNQTNDSQLLTDGSHPGHPKGHSVPSRLPLHELHDSSEQCWDLENGVDFHMGADPTETYSNKYTIDIQWCTHSNMYVIHNSD